MVPATASFVRDNSLVSVLTTSADPYNRIYECEVDGVPDSQNVTLLDRVKVKIEPLQGNASVHTWLIRACSHWHCDHISMCLDTHKLLYSHSRLQVYSGRLKYHCAVIIVLYQ